MTLAFLTMSKRELDRAEWMVRIAERRATQAEVAQHLGVSLRQVERLYRAYKVGGAAALVSRKRGRPSARRLPASLRDEVIRLVRERYADFGPTLAHEKLTESHGVKVSVETLRKWMAADGLGNRARSARRDRTLPVVVAPASASSFRSTAAITTGSKSVGRAARFSSTSTTLPAA